MTAVNAAPTAKKAVPRPRKSPPKADEEPRLTVGHGAVLHAIEQNTLKVEFPGLGQVRLPPAESVAWIGGLVTLAAFGIMEWPVAVVIGFGHVLAQNHHVKLLKDFGEALEEA